ncbi:MAG TPA: ELWxxDGT repeat protein [bacterium]
MEKATPKAQTCDGADPNDGLCGILYFAGSKDGVKDQLWRTDGTAAGTYEVQEINPAGSSKPSGFVKYNGRNYFAADDGVHGMELWVTDGTPSGTHIVADINPTGGSDPAEFVACGERLFFTASDGATRGLYSTDGFLGSAVRAPGKAAYMDPYGLTVMGDLLYFGASLQADGDTELWLWDGSLAQVAQDINMEGSSYPSQFTAVGDTLYFNAVDPDVGNELRIGDSKGIAVAVNACPDVAGPCDGAPSALWAVGSRLFFTAASGGGAPSELWMHDGAIGKVVKDINPGDKALIEALSDVNGRFVFTAVSGGERQVWSSDGTALGTQVLTNFTSLQEVRVLGRNESELHLLVVTGGHLELWTTDGTPLGTVRTYHSLSTQGDCALGTLGTVGTSMLFYANDGGSSFGVLRSTDAVQAGTQQIGDVIVTSCGV